MLPVLLGDKMSELHYCYITSQYYLDHPNLRRVLDLDDSTKYNIYITTFAPMKSLM